MDQGTDAPPVAPPAPEQARQVEWNAAQRRMTLAERAMVAAIIGVLLLALDALGAATVVNPSLVLAHQRYLVALGDSLTFGYQPDLNFGDGYVDDMFADLRGWGVSEAINLACAGETSGTMVDGDCPVRLIHHDAYTGAQLDAAAQFLRQHRGHVNPITLDIGANDVLGDFSDSTCSIQGPASYDLALLDNHLTEDILPRLEDALGGPEALAEAHLVLLNYYNPFAQVCPGSNAFIRSLNAHLAADVARFPIRIVDVYAAFGGDAHDAQLVCTYTWYCNARFHSDFHPTTLGYQVMARAVEQALGYSGPGASGPQNGPPFVPALPPFNALVPLPVVIR